MADTPPVLAQTPKLVASQSSLNRRAPPPIHCSQCGLVRFQVFQKRRQEERRMRSLKVLLVLAALLAPQAASAETVMGSGALALAALVGNVSPLIGPKDKVVLMKLLNGEEKFSFPMGQTITIQADKLTCRSSDVEITAHSCDLSFGSRTLTLTGRPAHELFATLAEVGVPPDGAAGSIYEVVANLKCEIDPDEVTQNSGGGAQCEYGAPN
jgi:hypothetical protein